MWSACGGEWERSTCGILIGRPERQERLDRYGCRWEDDIKRYVKGILWKTLAGYMRFSIGIATCPYGQGNDPKGFLNCREFLIS